MTARGKALFCFAAKEKIRNFIFPTFPLAAIYRELPG